MESTGSLKGGAKKKKGTKKTTEGQVTVGDLSFDVKGLPFIVQRESGSTVQLFELRFHLGPVI